MNTIRFAVTGKLTTAIVLQRHASMLFRQVKEKLSKAPVYENVLSLMAYDGEQEVGLLVLGIVKGVPAADVISLYVTEPYRKKGLATALFSVLDHTLAKLSIKQANVVYQDDWDGIPALEKILQHAHWQSPEKKIDLYKADLRKGGLDKNWIAAGPLPPEIKIVSWDTLSLEEKKAQAVLCSSPLLSPFQMEEHIAFNSQAAYINNTPAGYLVTHRIKEGIQFTSFFVTSGRYQGLIAAHLINTASLLQFNKGIYEVAIIIDASNNQMHAFSKRFQNLIFYRHALYASIKKTEIQAGIINK